MKALMVGALDACDAVTFTAGSGDHTPPDKTTTGRHFELFADEPSIEQAVRGV